MESSVLLQRNFRTVYLRSNIIQLSDHVIRVRKSIVYTSAMEGNNGRHCTGDYLVGISKSVSDAEEDRTDYNYYIGHFATKEIVKEPLLENNIFLDTFSVLHKLRRLVIPLSKVPSKPTCSLWDFRYKYPNTLILHL